MKYLNEKTKIENIIQDLNNKRIIINKSDTNYIYIIKNSIKGKWNTILIS